jgi:ABC-2 type transport system permease protein
VPPTPRNRGRGPSRLSLLKILVSQIGKDMTIWRRRPVVILATVASPIAYTIVVYFVSLTIGRNYVAVVVKDPGPQAAHLADTILSSEEFIARRMSARAAEDALQSMSVEAIITIPAGFEQALNAHRAVVTMKANNVNADEANDLRRSLPKSITTFLQASPHDPLSISVAERDIHSRDFSLGQFEFIPIVVFMLTVAGVMCSGLNATQEWETGAIAELLLAPTPRWLIMLAKLLAGWLQTMLLATAVVAAGAALGFLRITPGAIAPCIGVLLLVGLASTGLGMTFGVVFRRIGSLYAFGIQVAVVMFFLSGGMSEIGFLPVIVQRAAPYVPTYYAVHALDRQVFYGNSTSLVRDLAVLAAISAATVTASIAVFRRRLLI